MNLLMRCNGLLVLRDGHPFGDLGMIEGYARRWPLSQTLTGMIRTQIGFAESPNFFDDENNCERIFEYGIKRQIPLLDDGGFLAPVPSDIVFTSHEDSNDDNLTTPLRVNISTLKEVTDDFGTDIENRDWLIPYLALKDKPSREVPFFLHWDVFLKYLRGDLDQVKGDLYDFGTSPPLSETRLHNAIDSQTLTTSKGELFSNKAIYMRVNTRADEQKDVVLLISVDDCNEGLDIYGDAYLGGERQTVSLSKSDIEFPECPKFFENKKYLNLILATHGDFGSWCPDWLKPDLFAESIEWRNIPNTEHRVRLRSAYIDGHDDVSGWDYVTRKPKATKKLVKPGSVYVLELENPEESQIISELLWGGFLDMENKEAGLNGYGQLFVGNAAISYNN